MYRIRKIDEENFSEELVEMQNIVLPCSEPLPLEDADDWWIVLLDDVPVGFAALSTSNTIPNAGYLSRAGVLHAHRGHGLQKRLIRGRERHARVKGWQWLVTDTHDNPASANSLIACGYKTFKPNTSWAFATSTYWRKRLTRE